MSLKIVKIELGAFAAGEIPPPIQHTYRDFDAQPVDLDGFSTLAFNVEATPTVEGPIGDGAIARVLPYSSGKVDYTWSATDMAEPATYTAQMWVSDGVNRFASDLFIYVVYDGPEDAP